ncbi:MAG TPA: hypothetical protein VFD85_07130 [Gemmatimonadales bacterium]|nr:hypothetical protein [Gemmatimonadales bacterium]
MALAPPPARFDVPDTLLLKRLARGDTGVLDRIRRRYGLTLYAIAYEALMDARRAAEVVEKALEECARAAGESLMNGPSLFSQLATTAKRLSRDSD